MLRDSSTELYPTNAPPTLGHAHTYISLSLSVYTNTRTHLSLHTNTHTHRHRHTHSTHTIEQHTPQTLFPTDLGMHCAHSVGDRTTLCSSTQSHLHIFIYCLHIYIFIHNLRILYIVYVHRPSDKLPAFSMHNQLSEEFQCMPTTRLTHIYVPPVHYCHHVCPALDQSINILHYIWLKRTLTVYTNFTIKMGHWAEPSLHTCIYVPFLKRMMYFSLQTYSYCW